MPKVYNARTDKLPAQHTFVDRRTQYGNQFIIGKHGTRAEVVAQHKEWINAPEQAALRNLIRFNLRDDNLVCWCAPLACHADELMRIANHRVKK